ncbi:hypothetical protein Psta_4299 [Pirellula staleyi DSM 6068]|uniref:Carboxypeptidase regulatory-like domain-containing protein n=1 Tax=Pirellula staleyi (strain ATCC 27377 / DSM 6068 / ICPB 4128) TaxID=530564 RepID=D2R4Y5_PIRSD|nr:Ig-like domain-containing protein [Pirellula staleyi]ADB18947.1 hypothetical protein Psta_4299 [Pirellula staleyi DSM 6068]
MTRMVRLFHSMTTRLLHGYFGLWLIGMMLVGCGGGVKAVPVTGVVTLNGQPVVGAGVNFSPADGQGVPSLASTDEQGRFVLMTSTDEVGAMPGRHRVTVYHAQFVNAPTADAQGNLGEAPPQGIQTIWLVPERYSKFDTSGLAVEVAPGMPEVQLQLTSP